ncbi:uncharacterized protein LOC120351275 [Nilaparvata lugens]|uniref:uncharacterized protein LOC120351275 n=1 Tax=Nilaparvata lugens TaxID=108931 RepID=UPI00193E7ECB|nr:uncharacterized protein LOC120351275 [Nilaparvata lugens]
MPRCGFYAAYNGIVIHLNVVFRIFISLSVQQGKLRQCEEQYLRRNNTELENKLLLLFQRKCCTALQSWVGLDFLHHTPALLPVIHYPFSSTNLHPMQITLHILQPSSPGSSSSLKILSLSSRL